MFSFPSTWGDLMVSEEIPFELRARTMRSLVVPYRVYVHGWNPKEAMPDG